MGQLKDVVASTVQTIESGRDQLAYLGDMIRELSTIADRLRCATLTRILEAARHEAEIQARRR
jgi:hypothetical protein